MTNLSGAVEKRKKSLKAMEDANNAHVVELDTMKAMAELSGGAVRKDNGAERAMLAAVIIDNPRPKKANAAGYSSARKGYAYNNGFYGTFETGEERVPSYNEITGEGQKAPGVAPVETAAPAEAKKGLKEYWEKYKYYLLALIIIVAAIVAYKKL